METKEYSFIDKSIWPEGVWTSEPDKVQWPDADTGLPCIAKRHPRSGFWCGYVGVSEGHPMFGESYESPNVDVHGGLTYANTCQVKDDEHGICHVPGEGEPEHVWWFGFDCAHHGDMSPQDLVYAKRGYPFNIGPDEHYRPLDYVKRECASLARQLVAARTVVATT